MYWATDLLKDKRILITGASSGIGKSCAVLCSRLGAEIIACGRDEQRLGDTISMLSGSGHISLVFELTDEDQIISTLSSLKGSSPISGFIHSAGIERTNPLKTISMTDYVGMFKTNVASVVTITQTIMKPSMYDKKGVSIVLISSIAGETGERGKIEYSSTKSAISGMVKALALELASKNVRVNGVYPGMVQSEMLERMFSNLPEESVESIKNRHLLSIPDAEDIANMVVYLVSDLSKRITGSKFIVDSGYSLS